METENKRKNSEFVGIEELSELLIDIYTPLTCKEYLYRRKFPFPVTRLHRSLMVRRADVIAYRDKVLMR